MDKIIMCGYSVHRQYTSQGEKGRFYAFRLQSHGECDARLNGEPLRLKKGDLLMMVPGDRLAIHKPFNAADASDTSGDYYLLCQGDWIASWFQRLNGRRRLEVPTGESILDLWKLIIRETHRLGWRGRRRVSRGAAARLLPFGGASAAPGPRRAVGICRFPHEAVHRGSRL